MKILVLDDNVLLLRMWTRLLRGHDVLTAECPKDAFVLLEKGFEPELVLSDFDMPGMTGGEFCREFRKTSKVPLYIVTGRTEFSDDCIKDIGASGCIQKVFAAERVIDIVRAASSGS